MNESEQGVVVATVHEHYARQATPEVWAEVDALRARVAKLEALVVALSTINEERQSNDAQADHA